MKRRHPSPRLGLRDKMFWVALRRLWSDWKKCFYLVAPETLPRWHSAGFRLYWTILCKARKRVRGGKRISKEIRQLILQMVAENPTWGAPRIDGEPRMLGFSVSERTISLWMRRASRNPEPAKRRLHSFVIIAKLSLPWISSRFQCSPSTYCTASSSSATIVGASSASMSFGIPPLVGSFRSYGKRSRSGPLPDSSSLITTRSTGGKCLQPFDP